MRWEYKTINKVRQEVVDFVEEEIVALGKVGWELIAAVSSGDMGYREYYFKRELEEQAYTTAKDKIEDNEEASYVVCPTCEGVNSFVCPKCKGESCIKKERIITPEMLEYGFNETYKNGKTIEEFYEATKNLPTNETNPPVQEDWEKELSRLFYKSVDGFDVDSHNYFDSGRRDRFQSAEVFKQLVDFIKSIREKDREEFGKDLNNLQKQTERLDVQAGKNKSLQTSLDELISKYK